MTDVSNTFLTAFGSIDEIVKYAPPSRSEIDYVCVCAFNVWVKFIVHIYVTYVCRLVARLFFKSECTDDAGEMPLNVATAQEASQVENYLGCGAHLVG
jgi:hypothetical protein